MVAGDYKNLRFVNKLMLDSHHSKNESDITYQEGAQLIQRCRYGSHRVHAAPVPTPCEERL